MKVTDECRHVLAAEILSFGRPWPFTRAGLLETSFARDLWTVDGFPRALPGFVSP